MNFPMAFKTVTESSPGIQTPWCSVSGSCSSDLAIPPEFEGPGGGLSPEDLFNQALSNCFLATFKVYAEKSKVTFEKISVESTLTLDLNESKQPVMKRLDVNVKIRNPSNADKVVMLAQRAAKNGFILNSVKTECHFSFEVVA